MEMTGLMDSLERSPMPGFASAGAGVEARFRATGELDPPPVFVLGSHKSGSSLLRSLLDGHPSLAVLPKETHLFQFTNHWVDYRRRRNLPREMGREQLIETMLAKIREDTQPGNPYADAPGFSYHMDVLEPRLRALDPLHMPSFLAGYMRAAYEASTGMPPAAGLSLVEKSVEHAEFAYVLANYYPGARFIHIVRNPYATLVAVRRMMQKRSGHFPYLWPMACSLYNSYRSLFTNRLAVPNYLCVRFEDLVAQTRVTMHRIADFLNVEYTDALLQPTSCGKPWGGNSTSNEAFQGVSSKPLDAWRQTISDYEVAVANLIASPVLAQFGYERLEPRRPWLPARRERPKTWVANRMALSLGV